MEEIKNLAMSICVASICGTILNILLPEGNFQKVFKYILSIFFLCVVAAPLSDIDIRDFESSFNFEESSEKLFEENNFFASSIFYIEKQITNETSDYLTSEGIDFNDISIKINISEDGGIDINKFTLDLESKSDIASIKEKVKQKIGIEPEIFVSGESKNGNN